MTNDNFDNAIRLIGFGDNSTGDNTGFTSEVGETFPDSTINTAWWEYTAPSNGTLTIDTIGSALDTLLNVSTGFSVGSLTQVAFDDDGGNSGDSIFFGNSLVSFTAVRGTTYRIAVDGLGATTGNIILNLALTNATSGVDNDKIAIGDGNANALNTVGAGGNDVLDGKGGTDILEGGEGNDTYFVDDVNDRVINEALDSGIDQVFAKSDHILDTNVENLTLAGFANLNGTGNILDNVIEGNNGSNLLNGNAGDDTLFGGSGNDFLNGGASYDNLIGGDGSDTLSGGDGNDFFSGGDGNDNLIGGDGSDRLNGGDGNDTLEESGNVDFILSDTTLIGLGTDNLNSIESAILTGGFGNNTISASGFTIGSVILNGAAGNDLLIGGSQNDSLLGGDGNDTLIGGLGTDTVVESGDVSFTLTNTTLTGLGTDTLISIESANLTGGIGNNTIDARNFTLGSVTLNGDAGNDLLIGGSQNDFLNGGEGNDTLAAKAGNDIVNGGNGIDIVTERADVNFTLTNTNLFGLGTDTLTSIESAVLTGGIGNNTLSAIAFTLGSVTLDGAAGNDLLIGGSQNDSLLGGDGNDTLAAKAGNDTVNGGNGTDIVTEKNNVNFTLTNTKLTGLGTDTLISIESSVLTGGVGNNTLNASAFTLGSVTLNGDAGNDLLIGGSGNDSLFGGDGNDTIAGKAGNDIVNGGNGTDIVTEKSDINFTLTNINLTGLGTDTLTSIESAVLTGGVGNNTLSAIAFTLGSVTLNGEAGNDLLIGGSQNDSLFGGEGNDTIAAKLGNDIVNGGNGTDIVTEKSDVNFTLTNTTLTGLGIDTLTSIESSFLTGGGGNNSFNALAFTLGSVTLNGDAGDDVLRGGFKNDFLFGGDGDDVLRGAGNNNGVGSIDTLTGNAGNDTFTLSDSTTAFYNDGNNAIAGLGDYALIKDFNSVQDKIQLEGAANLYALGTSPIVGITGISIYKDTNSNGVFNSTDELIAIAQGAVGLNLSSSYFVYV